MASNEIEWGRRQDGTVPFKGMLRDLQIMKIHLASKKKKATIEFILCHIIHLFKFIYTMSSTLCTASFSPEPSLDGLFICASFYVPTLLIDTFLAWMWKQYQFGYNEVVFWETKWQLNPWVPSIINRYHSWTTHNLSLPGHLRMQWPAAQCAHQHAYTDGWERNANEPNAAFTVVSDVRISCIFLCPPYNKFLLSCKTKSRCILYKFL